MALKRKHAIGGVFALGLIVLARDFSKEYFDINFVAVSPLEPGEAARQIAALQAKIGHPLSPSSVALDANHPEIRVDLPNPKVAETLDRWSVSHTRVELTLVNWTTTLFDWTDVGGPDALQSSDGRDTSVKDRIFDLKEIDISAVPAIAAAAVKRVALQEQATITAMTLERPSAKAAAPRWTVDVQSPHESAQAFADVTGRITGANLDNTLRAKLLDLYKGGAPLLGVVDAITEVDGGPDFDRVAVYHKEIAAERADGAPDAPVKTDTADLNGLREQASDEPPAIHPTEATPKYRAFALKEVDWTDLPGLIKDARDAAALPDATVTSLAVRKRAACVAPPALEWRIDLKPDAGGDTTITLDSTGKAIAIDRRRADGTPLHEWDHVALRRFVADLACVAGPHAAIYNIVLSPRDGGGQVQLRDASSPGRLALLSYTGDWFVAFDPQRWAAPSLTGREDQLFDFDSIGATMAETLPTLESAAIAALKDQAGTVSLITIARDKTTKDVAITVQVSRKTNSVLDIPQTIGDVVFDASGRMVRATASR